MSTETTIYLAMTAAEYTAAQTLSQNVAWMACHFSAYSTGLSNCPISLPQGAVLMVNDRTPIWHHDPARILLQLQHMAEDFSLSGIVLDFQRPGCWETDQLTGILTKELPCPVAVSESYAQKRSCPVFLSSPPLYTHLEEYLLPWKDRQIWLEAALCAQILTVDTSGCTQEEKQLLQDDLLPFQNDALFCRYDFTVSQEKVVFTLQRGRQELDAFLEKAGCLGIQKAIGLYQQLH